MTGNSLDIRYQGLVNKQRYLCIMEYYTAVKKKEKKKEVCYGLEPTANQDGNKGTSSAVTCLLLASS